MHAILDIALGVFLGGLPLVFVGMGLACWLRNGENEESARVLAQWLGIALGTVVVYATAWFFTRA